MHANAQNPRRQCQREEKPHRPGITIHKHICSRSCGRRAEIRMTVSEAENAVSTKFN